MRQVELNKINIKDDFWSRYQKLVKEVMVPYQWEVLNDRVEGVEKSHAVENFKIAAGLSSGEFYGMVFQDSDLAKWLEAVGYILQTNMDKELQETADGVIDIIEKAQQRDGYLNTYFTVKEPKNKWDNIFECHELYCAGHMIEGGVAYYKATGSKKMLKIITNLADCIDNKFGAEADKIHGYCGHEEIELALIKLYELTSEKKYLALSKYFIDERGKEPNFFQKEWDRRGNISHWTQSKGPQKLNLEYNQAHLPVRKQKVAVGHAVRAVYLYTAMADIARESEDEELLVACKNLWHNMTQKQMYITGGIGSTNIGEAFTFDYDLPNDTVYQETCASIGLILFAERMLKIENNRNYADIMERALYNSVISGLSYDGKSFLYVNPMEVLPEASEKNPSRAHVKAVRQKWYACACCPPNIARLITSLGEYIYTYTENRVNVQLYIVGEAEIILGKEKLGIKQVTNYPWEGSIAISLVLEEAKVFTLALRIPDWSKDVKVKINGEKIDVNIHEQDGYACIDRLWQNKDEIELELDLSVKIISANPKVRANAGKVALQRGPLVYCIEQADNGENLSAITLIKDENYKAYFEKGILGGMVTIKGKALRNFNLESEEELYSEYTEKTEFIEITAVPYSLWGNRGKGEMQVWTRIN